MRWSHERPGRDAVEVGIKPRSQAEKLMFPLAMCRLPASWCGPRLWVMPRLLYLDLSDSNVTVNKLAEKCEFRQLVFLAMHVSNEENDYPAGFPHLLSRCPLLRNIPLERPHEENMQSDEAWFQETKNRVQVFDRDLYIGDSVGQFSNLFNSCLTDRLK